MAKRTKCLWVVVALSIAGVMLGCSASVGTTSGGNPFVAFTVGGKTITFTFGPAGVIQTRANQTVSQAGQIILFDQAPTDTPATGQMTLLSSSVSVTNVPTDKAIVQQPAVQLNGSAVVTFSVASGGSDDPCSQGTFLAQYDLSVVNGQVNVENEVADLSWDALQTVFENSITMCIEVWADFDGQLTMTNFSLTFGKEQDHDGGTGNGTGDGDGDNVTEEQLPAQVILNVTVVDNGGNPVSGQAVDLVAEKWTDAGPVPDRRFELACSTNDSGQCSGQMGFNLGGPTGEFARFTANVTADGTAYTESADFHIDPKLPPDQEQWLTESVTIQLGGDDDDTGDDGAGAYTAADLAGCWRVTVTEEKDDGTTETTNFIMKIDASGNLAAVWIDLEAEEDGAPVLKTIEFVRFTSPNAGFFAAIISNAEQQISVGADGLADISFSFDITTDDEEPPQHMFLNITDAVLSGDPPSSFSSDTVTSDSSEGTVVPPVNGQRGDCPVEAEEDVITQEEFELDFDISLCGTGTTLMMPLTFLALCWMKWRP
jgi:hypothetical protein